MAPTRRPIRQAFTLIELLVVIAIIAILTAILLPVFASVREGARQGTSISNMKDIQQKMEQFKLDNHRYPDVLFGYAYPGTTMKGGLAAAQAAGKAAVYFPGLYPAYIKDVEEFTDPNNIVNTSDTGKIAGPLSLNLIAPCSAANDDLLRSATTTPTTDSSCGTAAYGSGSTVPTNRYFYVADAYDSSPTVTGTNQISDPTANASYLVRYQLAREGTVCQRDANGTVLNVPAGCDRTIDTTIPTVAENYKHQLRWQNPPAETVIMATTYHVKYADKVLVMFESGAVKKMTGADFAAKEGPANFWQITP